MIDNQPIELPEQSHGMGEYTSWPQPPAAAPRSRIPEGSPRPSTPETHPFSGLEHLWLVIPQKPRPAVATLIRKMYFSHREPPGVCERRRSVMLEASIPGENLTVGVTARHVICPAPGNCTHIDIATTLRSLPKMLLLTSPLDLTRAACASIYHNISRIHTRPDAGIRPRTLFSVFQIPDTFCSRDRASYLLFNASRFVQTQQLNAN